MRLYCHSDALGDFRQAASIVSGAGESLSLATSSVKSSQSCKKESGFSRSNTTIRSVDNPEYTRTVDDIGEDFSGEPSSKYRSQTQQKFIACLVSRSPSLLRLKTQARQ